MEVSKKASFPIRSPNDIVVIRKEVRQWATALGFGIIDQTKVVTAASELARNTLDYGGGGEMHLENVRNDFSKQGLRLTFEDQGPGIPNLELALTDGYTTGGGLGMGMSGSKRLMNDFKVVSEVGKGTCVTIIKWK